MGCVDGLSLDSWTRVIHCLLFVYKKSRHCRRHPNLRSRLNIVPLLFPLSMSMSLPFPWVFSRSFFSLSSSTVITPTANHNANLRSEKLFLYVGGCFCCADTCNPSGMRSPSVANKDLFRVWQYLSISALNSGVFQLTGPDKDKDKDKIGWDS